MTDGSASSNEQNTVAHELAPAGNTSDAGLANRATDRTNSRKERLAKLAKLATGKCHLQHG